MKKRKGYSARPLLPINQHAIDRFREHWPEAGYMYDSDVRFLLSDQLSDALDRNDYIVAPGGVFVPFSILDRDGYAVIVDRTVRTVMPKQWCEEVDKVRKGRSKC